LRPIFATVMTVAAGAAAADTKPYAVTGFGGIMTDNSWWEVLATPWDIRFEKSHLAGIAGSARVWRPLDGLDVEIEGQVVGHFGDQTHWEFNGPLAVARWTRFPWNETVATSAAFGIGPSFATEVPAFEVERDGDSSRAMIYWVMEVEFGAPGSDWSVVSRLHHRSPAWGLAGDDGGSNALALGVRRRF
jgi:hypothetical protein